MKLTSFLTLRSLPVVAATLLLIGASQRTHAAFILTISQSGSDVVLNGSGSLNMAALVNIAPITVPWHLNPQNACAVGGNIMTVDLWGGPISGPTSFGSGGTMTATSTNGLALGISGSQLFMPIGYVSGNVVTNSATFANKTLSSLGFTPGTYVYSWGAGATADTFTVTSVVPEPSTWVLSTAGILLLVSLRRRHA